MVIPIIYTATVMPFEIFFVEDSTTPGWVAVDVTITFIFFLDMVMNFNVGYYDSGGWPVYARYECFWTLIDRVVASAATAGVLNLADENHVVTVGVDLLDPPPRVLQERRCSSLLPNVLHRRPRQLTALRYVFGADLALRWEQMGGGAKQK